MARTNGTTECDLIDYEDIEETIRKWIRRADTFATIGLFLFLLKYKLGYDQYFPTYEDLLSISSWHSFIQSNGMVLPTALVLLGAFIIVRSQARRELDHLVTLFSTLTMPQIFQSLTGYKWIPFVVAAFYLVFFSFAIVVDKPIFLSVALLIWNIVDLLSAYVSRANFRKFLSDPRFEPPSSDLHKPWIMERRKVAQEYLFNNFYVTRIVLMAIGNLSALLLSIGLPVPVPRWIPYIFMIGVLVANEVVMAKWRQKREREFAAIRRAERRAIRERTGESL